MEIVKDWVDEQYNEGRVTMITDGELEDIVEKTAAELGQNKYLRRKRRYDKQRKDRGCEGKIRDTS